MIEPVVADFRLLDRWTLPAEGERDDFGRLVELIAASIRPREPSDTCRDLSQEREPHGDEGALAP